MKKWMLFVLGVVGVVAACAPVLPPLVTPPPTPVPATSVTDPRLQVPASTGTVGATNVSAPSDAGAPQAAPPPPPAYHTGDYRLMLPTGRTVVPTVDGGAYAVVDGNERPCDYGCTSGYSTVGQAIYQKYGKPLAEVSPGDYAAYLKDYETCTKSCKPVDKVFWPGSR